MSSLLSSKWGAQWAPCCGLRVRRLGWSSGYIPYPLCDHRQEDFYTSVSFPIKWEQLRVLISYDCCDV